MDAVLAELAKTHPSVQFCKVCRHGGVKRAACHDGFQALSATDRVLQVEAEAVPDLSERFNITAVPTILLLKVWVHTIVSYPVVTCS